jgi:hypothetical protein
LGGELADLGRELFQLLGVRLVFGGLVPGDLVRAYAGQVRKGDAAPLVAPVGMDAIFRRELADRLLLLQEFLDDLGFEGSTVLLCHSGVPPLISPFFCLDSGLSVTFGEARRVHGASRSM